MAETFDRLYYLYGRCLIALGAISGAIVFCIMWLIDANALMRKFFNAPVPGTLEITEAALVLIIFLGLAVTQHRRGHIRVTLLTRRMSLGARNALFILAMLIGAGLTAWFAYAAYTYALRAYKIDEMEWGVITFVVWPIKAAISIGWGLLSFQFFLDAIRHCFVATGSLNPVGDEP